MIECSRRELIERCSRCQQKGARHEEGLIEEGWPQVVGKTSKATNCSNGSETANAGAEAGSREVNKCPAGLQASREHSCPPRLAAGARRQRARISQRHGPDNVAPAGHLGIRSAGCLR